MFCTYLIDKSTNIFGEKNDEQSNFDSILVLCFPFPSFAHLNNEVLKRYERNLNLF